MRHLWIWVPRTYVFCTIPAFHPLPSPAFRGPGPLTLPRSKAQVLKNLLLLLSEGGGGGGGGGDTSAPDLSRGF